MLDKMLADKIVVLSKKVRKIKYFQIRTASQNNIVLTNGSKILLHPATRVAL